MASSPTASPWPRTPRTSSPTSPPSWSRSSPSGWRAGPAPTRKIFCKQSRKIFYFLCPQMSFGWHRAEVVGAMVSVLLIWVVTGILVYLAVLRVISGDFEIDSTVMLITSGVSRVTCNRVDFFKMVLYTLFQNIFHQLKLID